MSSPIADPNLSPLYGQIQADLQGAIERGEYAPGSRLPSEHELCARYQVSRSTVRQALNEMLREGVIYKAHGRGTFVSDQRPFRDVSTLEGLSEALSAQGHSVTNRLQSFRLVSADAHLALQLKVPEGTVVAELARVRLITMIPVSYEVTFCSQEIGEHLLSAELKSRDILVILEQDFGVLISHADMQLKAVAATTEIAELLQLPVHEPLMRIHRTVVSTDGAPLLYEQLFLHGEHLDYHMRVERSRH
ncbi:hypothetical protein MD26_13355 [Pseudomonas sp. H2]|nr:hypothetical protein MD26_13355 [Pseudomonas sp. H2]